MSSELILAIKDRVGEPKLPPATEAEIAKAEIRLGFSLPSLLRELYRQVGNGRFGPGYGLLSLDDVGDREASLVDLYFDMRREYPAMPLWKWPPGLLAFCDWGCNIYSCLDCTKPPHPVLTYEYVGGPMEHSFMPTRDSFESWLRDWIAGISVLEKVNEHAPELDRVATNPFTKRPMVIQGRRPRRH